MLIYKFMNNYNEFINEKLGVNKDVDSFSDIVMSFVNDKINIINKSTKTKDKYEFLFQNKYINNNIINNKNINTFTIIIYTIKNKANDIEVILNNDNKISIKLTLSPNSNGYIQKDTISHEIKHLYQFTRSIKDNKFNIEDSIYYQIKDLESYYTNKKFKIFNYMIYLSIDFEIDAFVQECYTQLIKSGTTKDNFISNIKNNDIYKLSNKLYNHEIINDIRKDNPIKFVSIWLFLRNNIDNITNIKNLNKLSKTLTMIRLSYKLSKLYMKYFGEPPKFLNRKKGINLYRDVTEKEANDFLNKWDKIFKLQGYRFKKKIHRLYDNF